MSENARDAVVQSIVAKWDSGVPLVEMSPWALNGGWYGAGPVLAAVLALLALLALLAHVDSDY